MASYGNSLIECARERDYASHVTAAATKSVPAIRQTSAVELLYSGVCSCPSFHCLEKCAPRHPSYWLAIQSNPTIVAKADCLFGYGKSLMYQHPY